MLGACQRHAFEPLDYPVSQRGSHVDTYHGVEVPDPYRWLEDDVRESAQVRAWVTAQNELTFGYLAALPQRESLKERLTELWDYEKYGTPFKRGGRYYLAKNDGLQNHFVIYVMDSLDGPRRVLLNPNLWSEDGTVALDVARAYKPELILMDLMLPGADGWELTQEIRSDPLLGAPPVIVLSARVREADRQRAFDAGAVHFLPKPCRAGDLLEVIRTFLTEKDEASPEQIADVTGANALPDVPDAEDSSQFSLSGSMEFVVDMEDE